MAIKLILIVLVCATIAFGKDGGEFDLIKRNLRYNLTTNIELSRY